MNIELQIQNKLNNILNNNIYKKLLLNYKVIDTLVLSGGGIKGLYYIGILKKFEELNIINNIKTIAGSSIGAFFGVLISLGYTSNELLDFVLLFNLSNVNNIKINNFFLTFGIDDGNNLEIILEKMFQFKNFNKNITFKEHYDITGIEIIISGVCINDKKCYYFSYKNFPDMNIIKAIQISTAIPIYFNPIKFNSKLWVDGSVMNNFPINLFTHKLNTTLGIYLYEQKNTSNIEHFEDFFIAIFESFMEGLFERSINGFENNTIIIKSMKINFLFNNKISENTILDFINYGYNIIDKYLLI
jgi:predicted patatin/cPLA2 family phospholipase